MIQQKGDKHLIWEFYQLYYCMYFSNRKVGTDICLLFAMYCNEHNTRSTISDDTFNRPEMVRSSLSRSLSSAVLNVLIESIKSIKDEFPLSSPSLSISSSS